MFCQCRKHQLSAQNPRLNESSATVIAPEIEESLQAILGLASDGLAKILIDFHSRNYSNVVVDDDVRVIPPPALEDDAQSQDAAGYRTLEMDELIMLKCQVGCQ